MMIHELKLRKIGNSVGMVLPKEALSYLYMHKKWQVRWQVRLRHRVEVLKEVAR
jgi:antitoxin component of MazEF toxin-antitoxin module